MHIPKLAPAHTFTWIRLVQARYSGMIFFKCVADLSHTQLKLSVPALVKMLVVLNEESKCKFSSY